MQIACRSYKELKILTARPLKKNFQKIKHHLYGFQKSNKNFSTGDWLKIVFKKINDSKKKKKNSNFSWWNRIYILKL